MRTRTRLITRRAPWSAAVVCGLSWGCGGSHAPAATLSAHSVASPAGKDSEEPFLSSVGDTLLLSWLERTGRGQRALRFSKLSGSTWESPRTIAESDRFVVSWADAPSVRPGPSGTLWAHWPETEGAEAEGYGVRISRSEDGGSTWSSPWTPHEDGTATEHGFVAMVPVDGRMGLLWLDGRAFARGPEGTPPSRETALFFRAVSTEGEPGPETPLDGRLCDCCQLDAAVTSDGPIAVYRDRSPDEVRDIHVTRWEEGAWRDGWPVHEDGWETGACPINGPAVAAGGEGVVVAWFTAAGNVPRVKVAFSEHGGSRFGRPVVVDDGRPAGRVDVVLIEDDLALVTWLERTGGDAAEVRARLVDHCGGAGESLAVSRGQSERVSGFPHLAVDEQGRVLAAWTDASEIRPRVRAARIDIRTE